MPFTGSHPAAVLPFLRTPLPASALVAGSVAPDVPFYLPVALPWATHTALAVVTVDLLLAVLVWALWHALLAPAALAAAPAGARGRLAGVPVGLRRRLRSARDAVLLVVALLLGAGLHVLVDEFTHPGRWGAEHLAVLAGDWGPLSAVRWLDHTGTVLGAVALLAWLGRWWRRTPAVPVPARPRWWLPWAVIATAGLAGGLSATAGAPDLRSAAVAAAFRGGGVVLGVSVVLALAGVRAGRRWAAAGGRPPG
ncbi:DUF4184 family protein [Geodermatophilus sp. DSM 44513]|uniref:DUF4184 family protein n=1 Tax=Geodermatophilus sp. DSM 44513 TaxID=1528104 RepID=UPI001273E5E8|nr:DUF4184 family protein [Geodermatophilus sp. DSM 44513]WNV75067.1 DUF4184 family protein [Geodermatophilus sp. DSM 44513]